MVNVNSILGSIGGYAYQKVLKKYSRKHRYFQGAYVTLRDMEYLQVKKTLHRRFHKYNPSSSAKFGILSKSENMTSARLTKWFRNEISVDPYFSISSRGVCLKNI